MGRYDERIYERIAESAPSRGGAPPPGNYRALAPSNASIAPGTHHFVSRSTRRPGRSSLAFACRRSTSSPRHPQRCLQQDRGRQCVHVALPPLRRSAHLANRPQRRRRREALVDEARRKAGARLQLGGDATHLARPIRFLPLAIQRETEHEAPRLQFHRSSHDLGNRGALPAAPQDEARRRGDRPRRIAHCKADATLAVVDAEQTKPGGSSRYLSHAYKSIAGGDGKEWPTRSTPADVVPGGGAGIVTNRARTGLWARDTDTLALAGAIPAPFAGRTPGWSSTGRAASGGTRSHRRPACRPGRCAAGRRGSSPRGRAAIPRGAFPTC